LPSLPAGGDFAVPGHCKGFDSGRCGDAHYAACLWEARGGSRDNK